MSPAMVGFAGIGFLLLMLFFKVPVGVAMAAVGFIGFAYLSGIGPALGVLATSPYLTLASYAMSVVPLFVLMGLFAYHARISEDVYKAAYTWLGRMPGGLAAATVGGCAGFAACSGSSVATSATMGMVALPEMKKYHYADSLATGSVAAGGTLGILIPPSINLVIYGIITEKSIGRLFMAGILPGVLLALLYIAAIYVLCKRNVSLGPPGFQISWKDKVLALRSVWPVLALFLLVMGGIYGGVFTPTEAGAVGAFGAFLLIMVKRRLTLRRLGDALLETCQTTAMVMFIMIGAMILGYFLAVTRIPMDMANWAAGLTLNRYVILAAILLVFMVLGCIMDTLAIIMLVVPVVFPVILALGFDPIWFGVIMAMVSEMGLITPPVGLNVYVIKGIAKDVPLFTIFRGVIPFLVADALAISIIVIFPQIALVLPSLMVKA